MRRALACCLLSLPLVGGGLACKAPPAANPEFDDASRYLLRISGEATDAELAYTIRALEEASYLNMDLEANQASNRWVAPSNIEEDDVADLERPQRDLSRNLPIAVGFLSDYWPADHARVIMLDDHVPVEPSSPDLYDREFLEGGDCWLDRECTLLRTYNDVERKNILYKVRYDLYKDYRWVDLNLPDPADVPDGEEAVNEGEERWAISVRSWMKETAYGDGATVWQSFAVEVWVPRDCGGFVRDGGDQNLDDGDWTTDSCTGDGGTMRMQAMWSETELGTDVSEDAILSATRGGVNSGFEAYEDWLAEH